MKRKAMISLFVTVLCIAAAVGLRFALEHADTEYSEVKVTVLSSEIKQKKILGKRQTVYEVVVLYEGRKYDLQNTHGTAAYQPGRETTALLSGGELYANVEGVNSSTPLAMVYFGFLFASFAMVIITITLVSRARRGA